MKLILFKAVTGLTLFLISCGSDYDRRIVIKRIPLQTQEAEIEWYQYSLISGFSPGIVGFKTKESHPLICESHYISDIRTNNDTLIIQFSTDIRKTPNALLQFNGRFYGKLNIVIDTIIGKVHY